eukprot:6191536-Amphidinium_carterae.4
MEVMWKAQHSISSSRYPKLLATMTMSSAYTMSLALARSARILASTAAMTGARVVWNMRMDIAQPCGVPRDCLRNGERRLLTFQARVFRRQFSRTMSAKCWGRPLRNIT